MESLKSFGSELFRKLQRLGPAMMPVIAVMPVAGLLYGLGAILTEPTIVSLLPFLGNSVFSTLADLLFNAGSLITTNLHILFAITIAASFNDNDAIAGLSGGIAFLVLTKSLGVICGVTDEMVANEWTLYANVLGMNTLSMGVLGGIISGCMVAWLFGKFKDIKLPQAISFFQGKRFIPIISIFGALLISVPLAYIWPLIQGGISAFGNFFVGSSTAWWIVPIMVILLRLLLVFGLHTLLFVPLAYQFGTWVNSAGEVFHGAYPIYFAQLADGADLTSYTVISGNYAMIFSYIALGAAFIYTARKERKADTKAQIIPSVITVALTGISEPLEYSYLFSCFPAYILHSIVMALCVCWVNVFHFTVATGSWGGAVDFLIYGILGNDPTWLRIIPVAICTFITEFVIMTFCIKTFNLKTPGREDVIETETAAAPELVGDYELPFEVLKALGGKENVLDVDACATRLRISSKNAKLVNEAQLKALGAAGVVKVGGSLQIIFGPKAILLKEQISAILKGQTFEVKEIEQVSASDLEEEIVTPCSGNLISLDKVHDEVFAQGMMGTGFAVEPEKGNIVSPVNGKVASIFPTKHAISIVSDAGKEILIHMGLDTVKMNGEPFEILVSEGDLVSTGTPIANMDLEKIKNAGFETTVCVVFTNLPSKKAKVQEGFAQLNTVDLVTI
jgi:PTS system D-glucosamine-specific IIC component